MSKKKSMIWWKLSREWLLTWSYHIYWGNATSGAQLGRGRGEGKCSGFFCTWVESSIQNVVVRVSRWKSSKIFPCGAFFLLFLTKSLSMCPNSTKSPLPYKISGCASERVLKKFRPSCTCSGKCWYEWVEN